MIQEFIKNTRRASLKANRVFRDALIFFYKSFFTSFKKAGINDAIITTL